MNRTSIIAALAWRMAALQGEEFNVCLQALYGAHSMLRGQFQYAVAKERSIFQQSTRRCVLFFYSSTHKFLDM